MNELRFDANLKWLFTELPFEARFDAAAAAGFLGVEYASPYEYSASDLRRRLDDAGLSQVLINSPMGAPGTSTRSGSACIPGLVVEFRQGILRALEYATSLGAEFLHIVGGLVPDGVEWDHAFAQYVHNVGWAAEQAKGTGVRLLLEAQNKRDAPGFVLQTQRQAAAVAAVTDPDAVGVLMDFYHAQIDEGDLIRTYESLGSAVFHLQIADPPSRHEPGTGEIGYRAVFRAIRDSGYKGWIGCEYKPRTETVSGLGWIEELAR